jgi:hypothetical protein
MSFLVGECRCQNLQTVQEFFSQFLEVTRNRHPSGLRNNYPYTGGRDVK